MIDNAKEQIVGVDSAPLNNDWLRGEYTPICITNGIVRSAVVYHQWTSPELTAIREYAETKGDLSWITKAGLSKTEGMSMSDWNDVTNREMRKRYDRYQKVMDSLWLPEGDMACPELVLGKTSHAGLPIAQREAALMFGHLVEEPVNRWIVIGSDGEWSTTCGVSCIKVTPEQFVKISRGDIRPDDAFVLEEHDLPE